MALIAVRMRQAAAATAVASDGPPPVGIPLTIGWHTAFWAEDPNWTNPGNGNPVAQWDDASGNGRHATQTTPAAQPTYTAQVAALGNRPALVWGSGGMSTLAFTALTQPLTVVAVGAYGGTQQTISDAVSGGRVVLHRPSSGGGTFNFFAGTDLSGGSGNTSPHLFIGTANGGSSTIEIDGTQTGSGNAGSNGYERIRLGANVNGTNVLSGPLAFWGLYDGALPSQDKADLWDWVQTHYGL